jgi:hypothetical protein
MFSSEKVLGGIRFRIPEEATVFPHPWVLAGFAVECWVELLLCEACSLYTLVFWPFLFT